MLPVFFIIFGFSMSAQVMLPGYPKVTKTWICNTNADNKANWIGGDYMRNCTGFYFPYQFGDICLMSLGKLTTNAIYLPRQGDVVLREDAEIIFSEDSDTCVMVRDDLEAKDFYDPQCWKNDNEAVPDLERPPCVGDNAVFPQNATYSVTNANYFLSNSAVYTVRNQPLDKAGWMKLLYTSESCNEFMAGNPVQGFYEMFHSIHCATMKSYICGMRKNWRQITCSNPIKVKGHCTLFCGSVMLVRVNEDFKILPFFLDFVNGQNVDAYYSIVEYFDSASTEDYPIYQLTMTDKGEFTGDSISHAKRFYDKIKSDIKSWNIVDISANFSGPPLAQNKTVQYAMGILFGTLFAVIFLFVLMFLFYDGPLQNVKILPKVSFGETRRRVGKSFVFARFENKEDGTMSMGGSIVSLDKVFDNPMYGHHMPSTSSGFGMETVEEVEEMKESHPKTISESQFRNPVYDEDKIDVDEVDN